MTDVLVDASFLVAQAYSKDHDHVAARNFIVEGRYTLLLPSVVLPEALYNLRRVGGSHLAILLGESLARQNAPLIPLTTPDFQRAMSLMRSYRDVDLDFVDCCITAIAERLGIIHICTFDRRDFSIIRPSHVSYFNILP